MSLESELLKQLKQDVGKIAKDKLSKELGEVLREESEQSYRLYSPQNPEASRYRRGVDGSFADEVNIMKEVTESDGEIEIEISNHRATDCQCKYCRARKPLQIDTFIEEGIAGKSLITPKPFIESTKERIASEMVVENILGSELEKLGYEVE